VWENIESLGWVFEGHGLLDHLIELWSVGQFVFDGLRDENAPSICGSLVGVPVVVLRLKKKYANHRRQ